jgi:hypothetical protein
LLWDTLSIAPALSFELRPADILLRSPKRGDLRGLCLKKDRRETVWMLRRSACEGCLAGWCWIGRVWWGSPFFSLGSAYDGTLASLSWRPQDRLGTKFFLLHFPITVTQGNLHLMRFEDNSSHSPINLFSENW